MDPVEEGNDIAERRETLRTGNNTVDVPTRNEESKTGTHPWMGKDIHEHLEGIIHSFKCLYINAQNVGSKQDKNELLIQEI